MRRHDSRGDVYPVMRYLSIIVDYCDNICAAEQLSVCDLRTSSYDICLLGTVLFPIEVPQGHHILGGAALVFFVLAIAPIIIPLGTPLVIVRHTRTFGGYSTEKRTS